MHEYVDWAFKAIVGSMGVVVVQVLWRLADSVSSLNEKMAMVVPTVSKHDQRLDSHDQRLRDMERLVN